MPKLGMEPIRRAALIKATIEEVGAEGSLDVPVSRIAKRAGMSSALAHHYFGGKEQIFLAAMRHILGVYADETRAALSAAGSDPRARLSGIIHAGFSPSNFHHHAISAWLNFYVLAQKSPQARRLLQIYQRRLQSNLCANLRPLIGPRAPATAERLAGLIDGLYLREALSPQAPDGPRAIAHVLTALSQELAP